MKDWIPLLQDAAWILLIAFVVIYLRTPMRRLGAALLDRVERGAALKVGIGGLSAELGELQKLGRVEPGGLADREQSENLPDWADLRDRIPKDSRGVYLVHVIWPSVERRGWHDVFAFLIGHKRSQYDYPDDLNDVEKAEFFLGRYWGNKIFEVLNAGPDTPIGLATSAYGPTFCVCRILFKDGHEAVVTRYLDFEMSAVHEGVRES